LAEGSVDCVVMDPPYYDNVMYAELSDFFYVWLKRTAGQVFPELFRRQLTDKENEAVANPAKFKGQKGAKARAGRDYQERMASIFAECRRVLKPDGIMTPHVHAQGDRRVGCVDQRVITRRFYHHG
jgi:putative DNA methylase